MPMDPDSTSRWRAVSIWSLCLWDVTWVHEPWQFQVPIKWESSRALEGIAVNTIWQGLWRYRCDNLGILHLISLINAVFLLLTSKLINCIFQLLQLLLILILHISVGKSLQVIADALKVWNSLTLLEIISNFYGSSSLLLDGSMHLIF